MTVILKRGSAIVMNESEIANIGHSFRLPGSISDFLQCRGCVYKHTSSHANNTPIQTNNLWITQKIAPCGNRARYTLHGSQLSGHCVTLAVNLKPLMKSSNDKWQISR
ncbi:hypothetical protein SFRURICE_011853 [Spodoptera frugiperda]|nr:hypothetical protein SFRURICE_011853 [Spodoptera frugiperda]